MQQSVAVGPGFGGIGDADFAAGAWLVLDHEALTQRALQDFRVVPRHDGGRSAGRERHDDGHRPARITAAAMACPGAPPINVHKTVASAMVPGLFMLFSGYCSP